jgi:hypothetical protein
MPLRDEDIREEVMEAFEFANSESMGNIARNLASGAESDSELYRIASIAFLKAILEFGVSIYVEGHTASRKTNAKRLQILAKWMIQRYGADGCEVICRICMLGTMLEESMPTKSKYYIDMGGKKAIFDIVELFQCSLANARKVNNGTFKNSLG